MFVFYDEQSDSIKSINSTIIKNEVAVAFPSAMIITIMGLAALLLIDVNSRKN